MFLSDMTMRRALPLEAQDSRHEPLRPRTRESKADIPVPRSMPEEMLEYGFEDQRSIGSKFAKTCSVSRSAGSDI